MGTPDFAVPVLKALTEKHDVVCVYTQPPRPAGRGQTLRPSPIQIEAEKMGIPVRCPTSLKSENEQKLFDMLDADVGIVCAYGLILPKAILESPKKGCINTHASLLPRWRGAAPIQRAIMAGDKETGVTIMQMDAGLDTGDMLLVESTPITDDMTGGELHDILSELGAKLIIETLDNIPIPTKQPEYGITYAEKISKQECLIDWKKTAQEIHDHIRALSPFPKAYFMYNGVRYQVLKSEVVPLSSPVEETPGTLTDDKLTVACGLGSALKLLVLQKEGKKPTTANELLNGTSFEKGTLLA
jgi:methionyl-tRNA formyltransferase